MNKNAQGTNGRSLSRRDALRLSGVGALGVMGAGFLAACGDSEATNSGTEPTASSSSGGKPSGKPILVGGSLALTGFLSPSALIHKTAGELFVDRLNAKGGLLGRPVEWRVLDDQSQNDKAAAAYERLITENEVDLITGPYGTGAFSAAIRVAQRYGYVIPNHTGSLTYQYSYENHFPSWSSGRYPNISVVSDVLDMLEETGKPPKKIMFVVNEFPGSNYLAFGTGDGDSKDKTGAVQVAKDRGYDVSQITYPSNISDWAPIAAQIRGTDPDLIWNGGVGLDAANLAQALKAINYKPKGQFSLWSSPGPLDGLGETSDNVMLAGLYLPSMPSAQSPEVKSIIEEYSARAKASQTYPVFETQAASEWVAWEFLVQAVEGTESLDNKVLGEWLRKNGVESQLLGKLSFNSDENNYTGNESIIGQLQDGVWQSVWPAKKSSAKVVYPSV